jgi:ParB family transcriptional regulator, chromosome partitioning protein
MLTHVATDLIDVRQRLRALDERQVGAIARSIETVGLLHPIVVHPRKVIRDHISVDGYGLVAGAHRLEAVRRLGHTEIAVQVVSLSELERQLAECDENLCGTQLTPAERALFTKRRKEAYEALHPETRHGQNQHTRSRQIGDSTSDRFTADTAARTGQSERSVQRDAERGSRVADEALEKVLNTPLDKGTFLDALKKVSPAEQPAYVEQKLRETSDKPRRRQPEPDVSDPVQEAAEFLVEAVDSENWNALERHLRAAGASRLADRFGKMIE